MPKNAKRGTDLPTQSHNSAQRDVQRATQGIPQFTGVPSSYLYKAARSEREITLMKSSVLGIFLISLLALSDAAFVITRYYEPGKNCSENVLYSINYYLTNPTFGELTCNSTSGFGRSHAVDVWNGTDFQTTTVWQSLPTTCQEGELYADQGSNDESTYDLTGGIQSPDSISKCSNDQVQFIQGGTVATFFSSKACTNTTDSKIAQIVHTTSGCNAGKLKKYACAGFQPVIAECTDLLCTQNCKLYEAIPTECQTTNEAAPMLHDGLTLSYQFSCPLQGNFVLTGDNSGLLPDNDRYISEAGQKTHSFF